MCAGTTNSTPEMTAQYYHILARGGRGAAVMCRSFATASTQTSVFRKALLWRRSIGVAHTRVVVGQSSDADPDDYERVRTSYPLSSKT